MPKGKAESESITKPYLELRLTQLEERLESKLEAKMDVRFNEQKTTLDKIVGMLEARRIEDTAARGQATRHDAKLEDHERRIVTLEVKAA